MREPNALISTEAWARELGGGTWVFDPHPHLEPPPSNDAPIRQCPVAAASKARTFQVLIFSISRVRFRQHHAAPLHDASQAICKWSIASVAR